MKIDHLVCSICGKRYAPDEVAYVCPDDGGNLTVRMDFSAFDQVAFNSGLERDKEGSIWRYLPLLPVEDPGLQNTPLRQVGFTPLYQPKKLAEALNLRKLWIKDESRNPTASFKDRASALVTARAIQSGVKTLVAASTGNAGAAAACMAAAAGLPAVIIAPKTAPPAKVAQLLSYGAKVFLVEGNYDQAFELSIAASQAFGWYNRNTGYNPYTTEGKKTAAFEIWEQLLLPGSLKASELTVAIPVGDGNILTGVWKGFADLLELGMIDALPRIVGVQAEGSAAIANAFIAGQESIVPVQAHTVADSISVDLPRDGLRALKAVKASGGWFEVVTDEQILRAIPALGSAGIFSEPAAAAAYAGLVQAVRNERIDPDNPVVVLATGSGLKDVKAAMQAVPAAPIIEPTIKALEGALYD